MSDKITLGADQVKRIAQLARLKVDADQAQLYAEQLTDIMQMMQQMSAHMARAGDDIKPLAHPQDATLRLRDDRATAADLRDRYQKIAPATAEGLYLVPKVIDENH